MKRAIVVMVVLLMIAGPVFAATASSSTINTKATVSSDLSIAVHIFENGTSGPTGPELTEVNFGTLVEASGPASPAGPAWGPVLRSPKSIVALVTGNSHGLPYTIKQTALAIAYGAKTIPSGAFVVVPIYSTVDNGGQPISGTLGAKGSAVGVDKLLFTSSGLHPARTVQAIYAITDDPASGATASVPIDQGAGLYQGTIVFTVNA